MTSMSDYRPLLPAEISILKEQLNRAENWEHVFIHHQTDLKLLHNNAFAGKVYVGALKRGFGESSLPVGIYDSNLRDVSLGENCAIHQAKLIFNYTIGHDCTLFNTGIIDGRKPFGEFSIKVSNENGGRAVIAFPGMNSADAWLQSQYKDDTSLQQNMQILARKAISSFDGRPAIAPFCRLLNCQAIHSSHIGPHARLENILSIKNSVILSSAAAPAILVNGVILENVILEKQNTVKNHTVLLRVATEENVHMENGARITDCFIGANSTIACGESVSNLLFAFHEQHHNNSFLIATQTGGQCNIAAGATIGSNHNSRAADGELIAGRGFWPGLETDFKHNSRFASFTLVAKSSFDKELDIPLPFSLVSKNSDGRVVIYPAYWYYYNLYALARNTWKFSRRDKRTAKPLLIETDFLGPDSLIEMMEGIRFFKEFLPANIPLMELMKNPDQIKAPKYIEAEGLVYKEKALILNPRKALLAYIRLLIFFCGRTFLSPFPGKSLPAEGWENFGGQFIPAHEAAALRDRIRDGRIRNWEEVHAFYVEQARDYPAYLYALAGHIASFLTGKSELSARERRRLRLLAADVAGELLNGARNSREKDFENLFRKKSYRGRDEMNAVLGTMEQDPFLKSYHESMTQLILALNSNEPYGDGNGET